MKQVFVAAMAVVFATALHGQSIVEDSFDSYSAMGNFTADGGTGWAAPTAATGISITPGLTGSGKSLADANYQRDMDMSSPALDLLLVDPVSNRIFGGAGVNIWISFYMQTDDATVAPFNAIVGFDSAVDFATTFQNGFDNNTLIVNGGSGNGVTVPGSDLTLVTHIVSRWRYSAENSGFVDVWLNPTATTEAGLGAPDATTPENPGFIRSFNRIEFFGSGYEVDEVKIAATYSGLDALFLDGFESAITVVRAVSAF